MNEDDLVYFNNGRNSLHAKYYNEQHGIDGAFFDMKTTGNQARQAPNLSQGQECVVASVQPTTGQIDFDWYFLEQEILLPIEGHKLRVFTGDFVLTDTLPKKKAAQHEIYGEFFNVDGNFKRLAALVRPKPLADRPTRNTKRPKLMAEEIDPSQGPFIEGAVRQITINAYERNAKARPACLNHYGCECFICGFSFQKAFGDAAARCINVHHLKPLSKLKQSYEVDPIKDLRPVCPNCHAVIHMGGEDRTIEDVEKMLKGKPGSWYR